MDKYTQLWVPPLLPPLLLMLVFQKYDVIASSGYKNDCQKVIIDEDTTIFYMLPTIRKIMHFSEFQADFDMSKWL